jgi:hypothetical protein
MGKLQRTRGLNFEREVANAFKKYSCFLDAKRHLEFQIQEADAGRDLDNTGPLAIQCKRGRKYSTINAIFEVKPLPNNIPMLITRADNMPSMAVLSLENFFKLLELAYPRPAEKPFLM